MIGTQSSLFLFSILLLLLNSSLTSSAHAHHHHHHHHHHRNSAMDFLNSMAEIQRGESIEGLSKLKKHLSNLGYIENDINLESSSSPIHDDLFDETLEEAVIKYQSFFKLPPTGILDAATLAHMQQPRCGVRDVFHHRNTSAKYVFFQGNPTWPAGKRLLSYSFPAGERQDLVEAIGEAGNIWAGVSPFKFTYTADYDKADIKISLQTGDHGDGAPFDGRGGVMAHAFPPTDGRLHFDNDERWVNGPKINHFDFQTVGLHELGHVLGLGHSTEESAIMFPTIGTRMRKGLGQDDIQGIKALYPSG